MAAKLEKTRTPGVYKRGSRYAVIYRNGTGIQRQESARTLDDARRLRARRMASVDDGSFAPKTRERFVDYACDWVARYQGNGRRGFTEDTRVEYKRDLERYAIPFLGRYRLEQITPRTIAEFVAWLCDEQEQGRRRADERRAHQGRRWFARSTTEPEPVHLADASVRRILAPLRSCLATAKREGLIRHNPTAGTALPSRDEQHRITHGEDELEDHDVRALTTEELATLLTVVSSRHRLLVRLLAATGLRIGEALALRWGDVMLDGERPHVKVRRSLRHGRFKPPKSRYARRQVPIDFDLVRQLRAVHTATEHPGERDLVFCSGSGSPLDYSNLRRRVMMPAAQEAGVPWAGFHTLRHTCASRLFAEGRNAVQVQRWLGHHSPAFTLARYVHLLDGDLGEPLALPSTESPPVMPSGGVIPGTVVSVTTCRRTPKPTTPSPCQRVSTQHTDTTRNPR
jgi:integrase